MKNIHTFQMDNLYNIEKYNDEELYRLLDLNNPTDRELEAKILFLINQYNEVENENAAHIKEFFEDVYKHFFDTNDEQLIEGFESSNDENLDEQIMESIDNKDDTGAKLVKTTTLNYGESALNPLLKETQKRVLQLDSQFRNFKNYPSSTDYIINLSEVLNNVVSLRLHSVSIPYTWYNVSNVYNANYFQLIGNVDGLRDVYDLKFEIPAGSYNQEQLLTAINTSIANVAAANTDIDFGTTGLRYDINTSKVTLTLDIQQIYNESNYYLYFGKTTNPFDNNIRKQTISGFLGFGSMVIPRFKSNNTIINTSITSVANTYSLESIYSNFQDCLRVTGRTTSSGQTPLTNPFDPKKVFYLVIDDSSNNVVGNNYFTIYNYEGPDIYVDNSSVILDTIRIEFGDVSGLYTRASILELINRSLLGSNFLSANSYLHQFDISFNTTNDSITTMQRYQMMILLNRETTKKQKDSKQVVIFPDEESVYNGLPVNTRPLWSGSLWTGEKSCFLFDSNTTFASPNSLKGEQSPVITNYMLNTEPKLTLRCIKNLYNNNANNRSITLSTSTDAGYIEGYTLNNYIGIFNYTTQYKSSEINTKFSDIRDLNNQTFSNGYVNANAFYDIGISRSRIQFDMLTYFNETDYSLDLNACFLHRQFQGAATINITNISDNNITGTIPTTITNNSGQTVNTFPFAVIDNSNDRIIVERKATTQGLVDIPAYTIRFRPGLYRTPEILQTMVNQTLTSIQGINDPSGTLLNGLDMTQSTLTMPSNYPTNTNWSFRYIISNKLTQDDYIVELTDDSTAYENTYIDLSGNNRYTLERNLDASGVPVIDPVNQTTYKYNTPTSTFVTGTSWNAFLGFTDASYTLSKTREIVGSRQVMQDISKTMIIEASNNDALFLTPQSSVKGLVDSSGVKKITISIPQGIYSNYALYNEINIQLKANTQTENSIVYSSFDQGSEYTVFQLCANQVYTAEDYLLTFFDSSDVNVQNVTAITTNSFQSTTWDVTIGWLLGFRSVPSFDLNQSSTSNASYVITNNYTRDASTNIITLIGDTCLDLYLYKNLYLILNDFTQNHLNDGLITGVRNSEYPDRPSYSSSATRVCNPLNNRNQSSIFSASQPGMGLTEKQLFAANIISLENFEKQSLKIYSDPPYVKDMFAVIPIKVSGLSQGQVFTEYGGTMQDNDRKYFGPVKISKLKIQLLNDHGDVVNLNGANWSFSFVFEYLYNMRGL